MASKRITLSDGTKLVTASRCRFVTFGISDDSIPFILNRTDNIETADKNQAAGARRYLRVVTVDFSPWCGHGYTPEPHRPGPKVRSDSATWLPR